jgi:hypothetical protein
MKSLIFKILISFICLVFIGLHLIYPTLKIDAIVISLVFIGILPWIIDSIKAFELPGGFKIELKDVLAATQKVVNATVQISGKSVGKATVTGSLTNKSDTQIQFLQSISNTDPNLSLVGFRLELEKRIKNLGQRYEVDINQSLSRILSALSQKNVFTIDIQNGLYDLVEFGNKASHGAIFSKDASTYVLNNAPNIISYLDELIKK